MTAKQIIDKIKSGQIDPLYILHGEESYYIDLVTDYIEDNVLDGGAKAFNQMVLYGKDCDSKAVMDEARQYPMMAERRVVIIKEAQDMKSIGDLANYIKKPVPHTVLVISHKHKKIDKRTAFGKSIALAPIVLESNPLYDNQVPAWIKEYAQQIGLKVDMRVCSLMSDFLGSDLQKIANEMDKLLLNVGSKTQVTIEDVQDQIGVSKEYNVFELQNALGVKDVVKCQTIINYFKENEKNAPIQAVTASLFGYFMKVYMATQNLTSSDQELQRLLGIPSPYFVKDYRAAAKNYKAEDLHRILLKLSETDLKSKGVMHRSGEDAPLFQDLIQSILG